MDAITDGERIPVTLLTGFLGAGKTTVLNHLVRAPDAGRIAVVMNEFGDVGLDHDLIEAATEEVILMQSGCLCCTLRGDISKTLNDLRARRDAQELAFDRVVIETTGIADPGPILHSLVVDDSLAPFFRLDGIVTLADAAMGPRTLTKQPEAVQQIAMADLVLLSKTDLVTPSELSAFELKIRSNNRTARLLSADHGRVPVDALFGLSGMRPDAGPDMLSDWLGLSQPQTDPLAGLSGFAQETYPPLEGLFATGKPQVHNDHRIVSASIEVENPIPSEVFDFWLDTLIALRGPDVLRMKGIVHVKDMDWPFVFHGVQHIFDAPVPLKTWSGEDTKSRVVVIARNMSEADLRGSLETLRMRPKDVNRQVDGMMADSAEKLV